jgi:predicted ATP-grasp superfamily ATP-dependent carboligase
MPDRAQPSVAVMEWICGGGMSNIAQADQVPSGLRSEGAAMLLTIAEGLANAGVAVTVPLDVRLFQPRLIDRLSKIAEVIPIRTSNTREVESLWQALCTRSAWTWLVAPEIDDQLRCLAADLRAVGGQLINASEEFLANASDKLRTACRLYESGIAHPPTRSLRELDEQWLKSIGSKLAASTLHAPTATENQISARGDSRLWCVKPADGAGGEGLRIVTTEELLQLKHACENSRGSGAINCAEDKWIVQPWLAGIATSCSAFVAPCGHTTWLPLVSQDFTAAAECSHRNGALLSPHYVGSTYPAPGISSTVPVALLDGTLKAMQGRAIGWIGIDLLFHPPTEQWWVIEVNPRCTSSMVGLAQAYQGNLVGDLCGWLTGRSPQPLADFQQSTFRVARGDTHPT